MINQNTGVAGSIPLFTPYLVSRYVMMDAKILIPAKIKGMMTYRLI
jgi:hypothetical protein